MRHVAIVIEQNVRLEASQHIEEQTSELRCIADRILISPRFGKPKKAVRDLFSHSSDFSQFVAPLIEGEAKVHDDGRCLTIAAQHDIAWLEISVNDALSVTVLKYTGDA